MNLCKLGGVAGAGKLDTLHFGHPDNLDPNKDENAKKSILANIGHRRPQGPTLSSVTGINDSGCCVTESTYLADDMASTKD